MRENNKKKNIVVSISVGVFVFIMCMVFFIAKNNLSKNNNELVENENINIEKETEKERDEENPYIKNVEPNEVENDIEKENNYISDEPQYINELGEPLPDLSNKELEKISLIYEEPDEIYAEYLTEFQMEHEMAFKKYIAEYLDGNNLNMNVTKVPKSKITISDFTSAIGTNVFHCFIELEDGTAKEMDVIFYKYDSRFALTIVNRDVGRTNGMIRAE